MKHLDISARIISLPRPVDLQLQLEVARALDSCSSNCGQGPEFPGAGRAITIPEDELLRIFHFVSFAADAARSSRISLCQRLRRFSSSCPPCFLSTPLQAPALSKGTADLDSGNIPGPNAKLKLSTIPLGKRVIASQAPASTPSWCPGPGISTACGTGSLELKLILVVLGDALDGGRGSAGMSKEYTILQWTCSVAGTKIP
ncbi:hypothetical protein B0H14DRAFT_3518914 [Mycena olivaceomarginata]|nr:hypothetical protein B0H14DRAFT_3518914 [Mycena olivaceomarginata]